LKIFEKNTSTIKAALEGNSGAGTREKYKEKMIILKHGIEGNSGVQASRHVYIVFNS